MTVLLEFVNREYEGGSCNVELALADRDSIAPIMEWYGAYCAGDDYSVYVNGAPVEMDMNGAYQPPTLDLQPDRKLIEASAIEKE